MDIQDILQKNYIQDLIINTCGEDTDLITRQNFYGVRNSVEKDRDIFRVLILPPKGFTANEINQMNSHDEADFATIEIKGAVRSDRSGFSKIKDCLLVASKSENGAVSELTQPYLTFDLEENNQNTLTLTKHSAGTAPFYVVKNDGFGFYHNLINLTDDWLVLKLHKALRPQRGVDLEPFFKIMQNEQADILKNLYSALRKYGDNIFKHEMKIVNAVMNLSPKDNLPALGEMLYIHDSGMHEACTVFGIILKISNHRPQEVLNFLHDALKNEKIPSYYAHQLINKIEKKSKTTERKTA